MSEWKTVIPTDNDIKFVAHLATNYTKGYWPPSDGVDASEDLKKLMVVSNDITRSYIEQEYIKCLLESAIRSGKISRKWEIYKFVYFQLPLKRFFYKLCGKSYILFNNLSTKEIKTISMYASTKNR